MKTGHCPAAAMLHAAGPGRGPPGRRLLGRPPGSSTATRSLAALRTTGWSASAGSTTSAAARPSPRAAVRRLRRLQAARGMAWEAGRSADAALDATFREIGALAAAAQEADGYLNTCSATAASARYTDLEWGHELYCYGHLIQAAVARARTPARTSSSQVARARRRPRLRRVRADARASAGTPRSRRRWSSCTGSPGRSATSTGARVRRPPRHAALARHAARPRVLPGRHAGAARPRRSAATPCARSTSPAARSTSPSRPATTSCWRRSSRSGSARSPAAPTSPAAWARATPTRPSARTSSCRRTAPTRDLRGRRVGDARLAAAAGHRRGALRRPGRADALQRRRHRRRLADGTAFFYANPLHQRVPGRGPADRTRQRPRAASSLRAPWFDVSCCPTNIGPHARLASAATSRPPTATACRSTSTPAGRSTACTGHDRLPVVGRGPDPAATSRRTVSLRVPAWAHGRDARRRSRSSPATRPTTGTELRARAPATPRWTHPDPRVDAVRGCVAAERGPLVYCLESTDQEHDDLDGVRVDASDAPAPTT